MLTKSKEGKYGLTYLQERGFNAESIQKIPSGYSPKWDVLTKAALLTDFKRIFSAKWLDYQKRWKTVDRFKGRVMFPITVCLVE